MTPKARFYGAVVVSIIVLLVWGGVLGIWMTRPPTLSKEASDLISLLLGGVTTMAGQVVNFWVGSSASSAQKDAQPQQPPAPTA